jgi:hypothetical protein
VQPAIVLRLAGFVVMLGPTLLLSAHRHLVYLYAPHFFMALAIGALFERQDHSDRYRIGHRDSRSRSTNVVLFSRIHDRPLSKLRRNQPGAVSACNGAAEAIEISDDRLHSGLEPFFNPFYFPPNSPIKTAFRDDTINVVVEQPEAELVDKFCAAMKPRRFLRFSEAAGEEITAQIEASCQNKR